MSFRGLDSIERLLNAVSAGEAKQVGQMRMDVMRTVFDEQRRQEMRKQSSQPTEGKPQGGLRPWREVVTPYPDVASGRYQQAEFAADLWQVYNKEGSDEYKHPTEFFRRTFLTEGLRRLLSQAVLRLADKGGDPVVELQTNFGGGKTHSLLALWHLFSGVSSTELPGIEELVKEAGVAVAPRVRRAVFVGTQISPGKTHTKPDGTLVRTIWGEIAWQLSGKEGYKLVKADDEHATNPGNSIKELFNKYAPCLILFDEWVAYARQLHGNNDLPAGTFDTQFTFAQALSEAAKAAKQTLLVVSIPASESPHQRPDRGVTDIEVGGERGREALACLKNAVLDGLKRRGGRQVRTKVSKSFVVDYSSHSITNKRSRAILSRARSQNSTARNSRSFLRSVAKPRANAASRWRIRYIRNSSTVSTTTGQHWISFSALAASCG